MDVLGFLNGYDGKKKKDCVNRQRCKAYLCEEEVLAIEIIDAQGRFSYTWEKIGVGSICERCGKIKNTIKCEKVWV